MDDKTSVDLDRVHRQLVQAGQRRVAGAKVVQRQLHTQRLELAQHGLNGFVLGRQAFGHFQLQPCRLHLALGQQLAKLVDQARAFELCPRQVDRQHGGCAVVQGFFPADKLAAGFAQHHRTHLVDEPGLFGHANELHRCHQAPLGVPPADQRFHARQSSVLQVEHRLVDDKEFVVLQRAPQVFLNTEGSHQALVHGVVKDHPAAASGPLGFVHRRVGVAQHVLCAGAGPVLAGLGQVQDNANAGAGLHRCRAHQVGFTQLFQNPLGDQGHGFTAVDTFKHHHKFVAPHAGGHFGAGVFLRLQPGQGVAGPQGVDQALRDLAQEVVTRRMAQGVVDLLEAVQVHEQHGKTVARVPIGVGNGLVQALNDRRPVGQLGQRIGVRTQAELVLQVAPVGDVAGHTDKTRQHPIVVVQRTQVHVQPQLPTVPGASQHLASKAHATRQGITQAQGGQGIRVAADHEVSRLLAQDLGQRPAHQMAEGIVGPFDAIFGIRDHDHRLGVFGHHGQALDGRGVLFATGDVLAHGPRRRFHHRQGQDTQQHQQGGHAPPQAVVQARSALFGGLTKALDELLSRFGREPHFVQHRARGALHDSIVARRHSVQIQHRFGPVPQAFAGCLPLLMGHLDRYCRRARVSVLTGQQVFELQ